MIQYNRIPIIFQLLIFALLNSCESYIPPLSGTIYFHDGSRLQFDAFDSFERDISSSSASDQFHKYIDIYNSGKNRSMNGIKELEILSWENIEGALLAPVLRANLKITNRKGLVSEIDARLYIINVKLYDEYNGHDIIQPVYFRKGKQLNIVKITFD